MSRSPPVAVDSATRSLGAPPPLRPAPTFYPTEEEFADPIAYVRSIAHIGQRAGICKIVPPASWNPPFCLNPDTFTFRSKVQRLDRLQKRADAGATADAGVGVGVGAWPVPPGSGGVSGSSLKRKSGSTRPSNSRKKPKRFTDGIDPYSTTGCQACALADFDDKILLCDVCDLGYHMHCLVPPLSSIPSGDWFCPECTRNETNTFGFEMGQTFTLRQFKEHSERFTKEWFTKGQTEKTTTTQHNNNNNNQDPTNNHTPDAPSSSLAESPPSSSSSPPPPPSPAPFIPPTPSELSSAFWRIVEHPTGPVSVDYGSDLDTELLGSGFPKTGPYADMLFNCNKLAMAKGSVMNWLDDAMLISGVTIPWLYVGMVFSTFCWHVEDQWMFSINYGYQKQKKQIESI